jgi:hypothetical protein
MRSLGVEAQVSTLVAVAWGRTADERPHDTPPGRSDLARQITADRALVVRHIWLDAWADEATIRSCYHPA